MIGWQNRLKRRWSSASRTCSAERIDAVRSLSSSPSREAATRRLPPYSFAAKHAASACDSRLSKSPCGAWLCAMPMLAAAVSIWSPQVMRRPSMDASRRRPQVIACDSLTGTSTANSSPPVRATSASSPNSAPTMRPTVRIMSSPATWLAESLTSLKWSRSRYSRLRSGSAFSPVSRSRARSSNVLRLSRPVSGSRVARRNSAVAVWRCS